MIPKEYSLEGKVAIVTGAGRGIGKAIALVLAEAGADIVAAARTAAQLEETATEVRRLGQRCLPIPTDVTKADDVNNMVEKTISEFKKIDILVNNAGAYLYKPLVPLPGYSPKKADYWPNFFNPTSEDEWHRTLDTNLTSLFLCTRAVAPYLLEQRSGKVISITSMEADRGAAFREVYGSTKAAIKMFTRCLAREWGRYNINVNAIGPGYFYTQLSAPGHEDEELKAAALRNVPLHRAGELREIGLLAVYLTSDASNFVTGQTIYIDGGELA